MSEFPLISLVGMTVFRVALYVFKLVISFMISSYSTNEKLKCKSELQLSFIAIGHLYFDSLV